jgi:RHS repeat-associated protein
MRFAAVPAREPALGDLSYDRASNLASWKVQSGTSATAVTAKHDAWNRLTEVSFGGTLRCRQAHNALHWRSFQLSDRTGAGAGPDGTMDQARLMSYGADWRLLEERVDDNLSLSAWTEGTWSPGTDLDRVQQYVWGTRYVDDIVLHRVDKNMDGDYSDPGDGTWHHLTDAQFSSVCLIDKAFAVAERVTYSAYGVATHIPMADLNSDGAVNGADIPGLLTAFGSIGSSPYQSPADLNRDGMVNSADLAMLLGDFQAAQPDGALSRPNVDNPIGWDGYVFDRESGLYTVRFRTYETGLGRWIERDPAGYVDGFNLWNIVSGGPIGNIDPEGLKRIALVLRGQSFFGLLGDSEELMQKTKEAIANQAGATIVAGGEDDDLFEVGRRKICDALVAGCKRECGTMESVIIVGHSNGGDAARKIAAQLKSPGCFGVPIDVELLVTLDPIGKPVHDREAVEQVSENVKRAVNFYQRQDRMHFYLPFSKGFRLWGYQLGGPNVSNLEVERSRFTARILAHPWWVHGAVPNVVANDVGGLAAATSERNGANKCAELLKSARRASGQ